MWCFTLHAVAIVLGMVVPLLAAESSSSSKGCRISSSLDAEKICQQENGNLVRPHSVSITEFGAVGDGRTVNTVAFQNAVFYLQSFAHKGGAQLYVPAGRWLTGSFSLISHLTLFLDEGSVILASQDPLDWPLIDPLPSYGRGRDLPGRRHRSLIYGKNLEDVVITGGNGTINGQGSVWWSWFNNKTLNYTRGHLMEFVDSKNIIVSNITLLNSPFWTLHPVYCSNVLIKHVTVTAPSNSPNTDGIQPDFDIMGTMRVDHGVRLTFFSPSHDSLLEFVAQRSEALSYKNRQDADSCSGVCIEDSVIASGGDAVSVKSGWDQYGIQVGLASANIVIRRVRAQTAAGAAIALGSEMSGGIKNVLVEDLQVLHSRIGLHLKTGAGRGGYVTNISFTDVFMDSVHTAIVLSSNSSDHPDDGYDPVAYPTVRGIYVHKVWGRNISHAGSLQGLEAAPFTGICLSNMTLQGGDPGDGGEMWDCRNVQGSSTAVSPRPCAELRADGVELVPDSYRSAAALLQM